jgi:phytepsin
MLQVFAVHIGNSTVWQVYPVTWEVMIDDVYLDDEKLPQSTLSPSIQPSALVDTVSVVE